LGKDAIFVGLGFGGRWKEKKQGSLGQGPFNHDSPCCDQAPAWVKWRQEKEGRLNQVRKARGKGTDVQYHFWNSHRHRRKRKRGVAGTKDLGGVGEKKHKGLKEP